MNTVELCSFNSKWDKGIYHIPTDSITLMMTSVFTCPRFSFMRECPSTKSEGLVMFMNMPEEELSRRYSCAAAVL